VEFIAFFCSLRRTRFRRENAGNLFDTEQLARCTDANLPVVVSSQLDVSQLGRPFSS
jgi:hypothetical protein